MTQIYRERLHNVNMTNAVGVSDEVMAKRESLQAAEKWAKFVFSNKIPLTHMFLVTEAAIFIYTAL